ncbi:MAG: hypothetical protein H6P96_618 [Candidatus Aminicenantes bacterium]|jgi:hypothetical protein|nr:hypothetical protein [Candidatus Aminicenantes bacterium]MBP1770000.1 hypothetical protein [Candidatus Aminicenantes bacterium]
MAAYPKLPPVAGLANDFGPEKKAHDRVSR